MSVGNAWSIPALCLAAAATQCLLLLAKSIRILISGIKKESEEFTVSKMHNDGHIFAFCVNKYQRDEAERRKLAKKKKKMPISKFLFFIRHFSSF